MTRAAAAAVPPGFVYLYPSLGSDGDARINCFWPEAVRPDVPRVAHAPGSEAALRDVLPAPAVEAIASWRRSERPWSLVLDRELPQAWRSAPWESLTHSGVPLANVALVSRDAVPTWSRAPASPRGRDAWINLFPSGEYDFRSEFQDLVASERLSHRPARFVSRGLDWASDLFVLAHGDSTGLIDLQGRQIELDTAALPSRVWLLACNVQGAMYGTARRLLSLGVKTVVTSTGDLSAPEMAGIVRQWVERKFDIPVAEWLATLRRGARASGGFRALTVFGEVTLDPSFCARWNRETWESISQPERIPRLDESDRLGFELALEAIREGSPALWTRTRAWLLPEVLVLAENLDHQAMQTLLRDLDGLPAAGSLCFPMANALYRLGRYELSARWIVQGLLNGPREGLELARTLGLLTNVLIDMNLPRAAACALEAEDQVSISDAKTELSLRHKRADRIARTAFREQRFAAAIQAMLTKYEERAKFDQARELAWLVYMQSWAERSGQRASPRSTTWVSEAIDRLTQAVPTAPGRGNDDAPYLVRALACRAWAAQDPRAAEALRPWREAIEDGCRAQDPGPWAFARAFLALSPPFDLGELLLAVDALKAKSYLLEASAFLRLGGLAEAADRCAADFESRQAKVCEQLRMLQPAYPEITSAMLATPASSALPM